MPEMDPYQPTPYVTLRHPLGDLYQKLFALKRENTALWNAQWGGG
jgi:hypothetical protein